MLLPETDREHAEAAAARLQSAVAELDGERPVSVTIGVGHVHHPGANTIAHRLVAMADVQLYERKLRWSAADDPRQPPR